MMSNDEQRAQHESIKNIESATHSISNKQLAVIAFLLIMGTAGAVTWYYSTKDKDTDKFTHIEKLMMKQHYEDSINFIQLKNLIDGNKQSSDTRFDNLEKSLDQQPRNRRSRLGYVNEKKDPGTGEIQLFSAK